MLFKKEKTPLKSSSCIQERPNIVYLTLGLNHCRTGDIIQSNCNGCSSLKIKDKILGQTKYCFTSVLSFLDEIFSYFIKFDKIEIWFGESLADFDASDASPLAVCSFFMVFSFFSFFSWCSSFFSSCFLSFGSSFFLSFCSSSFWFFLAAFCCFFSFCSWSFFGMSFGEKFN